jgi:CHAT domain-containing protein
MGADLVMARLEADPDLGPLRDALRMVQGAREDLALRERELAGLRGQGERLRKAGAPVSDDLALAEQQVAQLEAERADALSSFEAAQSAYEAGLEAAGLDLDPELPSMDEIVDALPEGGVLAVPIPGADDETGTLLIVGRGPDGAPEVAWSEVPGLNEEAGRALLFGERWIEGENEDPAPGWFDAYSDLKGRLEKSGGVADPHGPAQTALDASVRVTARRLWDMIMGPLDHALRAFGAAPGAEVVMMPPGRLAALPLAAAHPEPEAGAAIRPFVTDWALSLVPSPQALVAAAGRIAALEAKTGAQPARLLCVATPKEFAPNPVADLASRGARREIEGPDATPEAVRAALAGHRHAAFLCHGHWNPQEPGSSGLVLAGPLDAAGRETVAMLTVGDLQRPGVATGDARSWLLMACETAPVGLDAPDEFAGLAVRLAGEVPAVTGTLYPVLLGHAAPMGRAILALQMGPRRLSPAQALRRAQLTAKEGGTPALEALAAEAIGPAPKPAASVPDAPGPAPAPALKSSAASFSPDAGRALGMPRDHEHRALFDDFDDGTPADSPSGEPTADDHDPDDWTTHIPAHWAAYTTYGR